MPPPGSYGRNSDFALNQQRRRGFSFGNDKRSTFDGFGLENPGPGKYDRIFNNYSRISFSFRSKYEDPLERHKNVMLHLCSSWDLVSITAFPPSPPLGHTSIQNTRALAVEGSERRAGSKMRGLCLPGLGNTMMAWIPIAREHTSTLKFHRTMSKVLMELTGRPSTNPARLRGQALTMCCRSLRLEINHFKDDSNNLFAKM